MHSWTLEYPARTNFVIYKKYRAGGHDVINAYSVLGYQLLPYVYIYTIYILAATLASNARLGRYYVPALSDLLYGIVKNLLKSILFNPKWLQKFARFRFFLVFQSPKKFLKLWRTNRKSWRCLWFPLIYHWKSHFWNFFHNSGNFVQFDFFCQKSKVSKGH